MPVKNKWKEIYSKYTVPRSLLIRIAAVLMLTAFVEWFYFGFCNTDFMIPISNSGDGLTGVLSVKNIISESDKLKGWPFFTDLSNYSAQYSMIYVIFIRLCGLFTKNIGLIFNLYLFAIPLFNVLMCYFVLHYFKVRDWLAWLGSLTFGFCPYVQYRLTGHMALASIECIPLVFLLCIWCVEDPDFNKFGKRWIKYSRNWLALFFTWMIANNGMIYYPFFSCAIFCITALCLLLQKHHLNTVTAPLLLVMQTTGWLLIGFLPTVWGHIQGHGNLALEGAHRRIGEAVIFSLQFNSLLLSPKGYGLPIVKNGIRTFRRYALDLGIINSNESANAYMGIIAILGFLLLILCLFSSQIHMSSQNQLGKRLWLISRLTVGILLLSVQSGFGTIINIVVTPIRGYNRISPFLVFCGVFTIVLCIELLLQKMGKQRKTKKYFLIYFFPVLFIYGLWEQSGCYNFLTSNFGATMRQNYEINKKFLDEIEKNAGIDAMIFQLPYMRSFENTSVNKIPDYDHLRGLLYSNTLRWSYGAINGTKNDMWYKVTSQLEPKRMVEELYVQGFSGIWLNLDGYETEEGAKLKDDLCAAAHCTEPIFCGDGHTIYIPLSNDLYSYSRIDPATDEIREITYIAVAEIVSIILDDLAGNDVSIQYLQNELESNGLDGIEHTIILPSEGIYQIRYKTPEDKGELKNVNTVVEANNFSLQRSGEYQIASYPMTIKENTPYKVEITLSNNVDFATASGLILDFYGGAEYDNPEQEISGFVLDGKYKYTLYLNSGEFGRETLNCYSRLTDWNLNSNIEIERFSVVEMENLLIEE